MTTLTALLVAALVTPALAGQSVDTTKKGPCDPHLKYDGNTIEITVGNDATTSAEIYVCFGEHEESYDIGGQIITRVERDWYDADASTGVTDAACLKLSELPAQQLVGGQWPDDWTVGHRLDSTFTTKRFALCGNEDVGDTAVWEQTHRHLAPDAWDHMRLYTKSGRDVRIDRVRVVQNRVRILDDELTDQGDVNFLMDLYHNRQLDLSWRIRNTKLSRLECLNTVHNGTMCDEVIGGLDYQKGLPPVVETALLELGRSGSQRYLLPDSAWCSEFAFWVIDDATNLRRDCPTNLPNPLNGDFSISTMDTWFSSPDCNRRIDYADLKNKLRAGDYLSIHGRTHSTIFLAWADGNKDAFWEISGNSSCRPELETDFVAGWRGNMVCISRHDWSAVESDDFGGRVRN